jgi:hypothetical protein
LPQIRRPAHEGRVPCWHATTRVVDSRHAATTAQLATDLPWPQPRRTLGAWRDLLEQARDDEAVMDGVRPEDLAAAIVSAAQWRIRGGGVGLTDGDRIEPRVLRLLDGAPPGRPRRSCAFAILVASSLVAALIVGFTVGDELLARLPGVVR